MVGLLIVGFMAHKAEAASIIVNPPDAYGRTFVDVFGELALDDVKTFQDAVRGLTDRDKIIVSLNGPGGEAIALQIGELIRLSGMKTYVAPNGTCESVCAFIWLAGNPRYAGTGANIGFHGVYNQNTGLPGKFNLITATYLGYLGFAYDAILWMLDVPPMAMHMLTLKSAKQYSISFEALDPPRAPAKPAPQVGYVPSQPVPPSTQPVPSSLYFKCALALIAKEPEPDPITDIAVKLIWRSGNSPKFHTLMPGTTLPRVTPTNVLSNINI